MPEGAEGHGTAARAGAVTAAVAGRAHRTVRYSVVVPTIGRESLRTLLDALDRGHGPAPVDVVVVDDRRPTGPGAEVPLGVPPRVAGAPTLVCRSGGRGPAAARQLGWQQAQGEWIAFLDDDVVPDDDWRARLVEDVSPLPPVAGGSQGRIRVPRPAGRRPTDWERNVIALEHATWATADLAYRVEVLRAVGGFDLRFERAFREDADLGLRVSEAGWTIVRGERGVTHPVRPATAGVSVRAQRGNRDDQLMAMVHGPAWRDRAAAGPSRTGRHLATVGAAAVAAVGAATGHRRLARWGTLAATAGVGELAAARVLPGPRTAAEVATMLWTSAAIPFCATWHLGAGLARRRHWRRAHGQPVPVPDVTPLAVLFDRDGTLVVDVPYNGDPDKVVLVPGAQDAVARLRAAGLRVGVVSNQSGVGRGLVHLADVARVNARIQELLGPMDTWQVCPHPPEAACGCRKPAPGLVERAAAELGVPARSCVVIGDIGADLEAARRAGARGILVPTPATRAEEVAEAAAGGALATSLGDAAARVEALCAPSSTPPRTRVPTRAGAASR